MKKQLLPILSVLLLSVGLHAQLVNPDFENWSKTSANKDSTHSWSSTNLTVNNVTSMITTLIKSNSAQSGTAAAELNTTPFGFVQTPVIGILVNGEAHLNFDAVSTSYISGGGCAISSNPSSVDGFYKISGTYDALITVLISKYNPSLQKRDTLALNSTSLSSSASSYTAFSLPISYSGSTIGDTATVVIYSSDPAVVPASNCQFSTLSIDNLSLIENMVDGRVGRIDSFTQNDTLNTTLNVAAWVYNVGNVNISNFPITYEVNSKNTVTETFSGTILPGDSAKYTFSKTWTPTSSGGYSLCVYLSGIAQDINLSNDTSCIGFYSNLSHQKYNTSTTKLFPNPANGELEIHLSEPCQMVIFNSTGAEMERLMGSKDQKINISSYDNGIYQLLLVNQKTGEILDNIPFLVKH